MVGLLMMARDDQNGGRQMNTLSARESLRIIGAAVYRWGRAVFALCLGCGRWLLVDLLPPVLAAVLAALLIKFFGLA